MLWFVHIKQTLQRPAGGILNVAGAFVCETEYVALKVASLSTAEVKLRSNLGAPDQEKEKKRRKENRRKDKEQKTGKLRRDGK